MTETHTARTASRRAVVRTAAWAAPTAAVSMAAPAFASSEAPIDPGAPGPTTPPETCTPEVIGDWYSASFIRTTDYVYENHNWMSTETPDSTPSGVLEMQHWAEPGFATLRWRLAVAFLDGTEGPVEIRIPNGPRLEVPTGADGTETTTSRAWTINEGSAGTLTAETFERHTGNWLDGGRTDYVTFPQPTITTADGGDIIVRWEEPMPALSAGMVAFSGTPSGGAESVEAGEEYAAEASVTFWDGSCL